MFCHETVFVSQVLINALKTASAVSGLKSTQHLSPCVNKSGPTPTVTRPTPKPQAGACSSGSMGQIPTKRLQIITLTMAITLKQCGPMS